MVEAFNQGAKRHTNSRQGRATGASSDGPQRIAPTRTGLWAAGRQELGDFSVSRPYLFARYAAVLKRMGVVATTAERNAENGKKGGKTGGKGRPKIGGSRDAATAYTEVPKKPTVTEKLPLSICWPQWLASSLP